MRTTGELEHWAILEPPRDKRGVDRALFFEQAFGARRVKLLNAEPVAIQYPGQKGHRLYYCAAVFETPEAAERFTAVCLTRKGGDRSLESAREVGFFPVNVDGITLLSRAARPSP